MSAPSDTTRPRLLALDWLRGLAVLVMVECHVFNALLSPALRDTGWFSALNWLNGLVAPAFLLVSGGVMGMNLQSRWDKGTGKLWRRIGQIFIVAYLLHLPTPLLWQFFGARGPHLIELWTKQDILQCVAGSLALILALVPVTRRPELHRVVCLGLGVLAGIAAWPLAQWVQSGVSVPAPLLNYLWPTGVGKFPLVPWAAFPLIGVWLGPYIFAVPTKAAQTVRAVLFGIAIVLAARLIPSRLMYDAPFVFSRMGWLLVALGACVWLGAAPRGTKWILEFGQLSLWSYTVHLIIVYGSCLSLGLDTLVPRIATWWVRRANPEAPAILGFSLPVTLVWLALVLYVTARVVRWRAKSLQRQSALRKMQPAR
jgi:uncharacterized membrane protein